MKTTNKGKIIGNPPLLKELMLRNQVDIMTCTYDKEIRQV